MVLVAAVLASVCGGATAQEGEAEAPSFVKHLKRTRSRLFQAHDSAKNLVDVAIANHDEAVTQENEIRRLLHDALRLHGETQESFEDHVEALASQGTEALRNEFPQYSNVTRGAWSVLEILARLDDESAMALGEEAEELEDELLAVRTKLAGTLSNATMAALNAETAATAEGAQTGDHKPHAKDAWTRTSAAYRLLKKAVELRQKIEDLRDQIEDAIEHERAALDKAPEPDCVAHLLDSAEAEDEVHKELDVRQEFMCRAMIVHALEAGAEGLGKVTKEERHQAAKGACEGVRRIYGLKRHPDAAQRSCRRMRVVIGEVTMLGEYRLYLDSYRCNPEGAKNATCSGNGVCGADGKCFCKPGWTAADCGIRTCPDGCSGNGFCNRGACKCDQGWTGETCAVRDCPMHKGERCGGNGLCERDNSTNSFQCMCKPGFKGLACEQPVCAFGKEFPFECSSRGSCGKDGKCKCFRGFAGETCERREVKHGYCNKKGGCVCDKGYNGAACDLLECPKMCSGDNGVCDGYTGKCLCKSGWRGSGCQYVEPQCPRTEEEKQADRAANATGMLRRLPRRKQCSARGLCKPRREGDLEGKCVCPPGFIGESCEFEDCPGQRCGEGRHGYCQKRAGKNGVCKCFTGYEGEDCSKAVDVPVKCGQECFNQCLTASGCTVSRTGGKHNRNAHLYKSKRSSEEQELLDALLATQLPASASIASPNTGKLDSCFLACSQQCMVERCFARGAEREHPEGLLA